MTASGSVGCIALCVCWCTVRYEFGTHYWSANVVNRREPPLVLVTSNYRLSCRYWCLNAVVIAQTSI